MATPVVLHAVVAHRRRIVCALALIAIRETKLKKVTRSARANRPLFDFEEFLNGLSDHHFKRVYRLPRVLFFDLCAKLQCYYRKSGRAPQYSRIPIHPRLSMTLRWLAGGNYLDIALWHHVSVSTFYSIVDETAAAIDSILQI
jgi:hypothetical protein